MHQIRKRLTYANVMSSIAVFLVLGGAAIAATQLPRNSVGTKQLKRNAVTTPKIKNNAVTTAKIKNGAVTGAKVNLGSLGTVPSATNAANANTVGGRTVTKVFAKVAPGSTSTLGTFGIFKIVVTCNGGGNPEIELDPQGTDDDTAAMGTGTPGGAFFEREQGKEPNSISLSTGNERGITTFSAAESSGAVVTGTIGYDDTNAFDSEAVCAVYGQVVS